jgi:hypothetical protein
MSFSSGEDGSASGCVVQGSRSVGEFCAGQEAWLEGACLAHFLFEAEDTVSVAILHVGRNRFLVLEEEGDFPCTEPWHRDGWVDDLSQYYYFGCLVYMDPFDERLINFLVFFVVSCIRRVALHSMIRWVSIVAGWMLVIGGSFASCSCYSRFLLSRVWKVFLVG